jgi:O-antigen ligase
MVSRRLSLVVAIAGVAAAWAAARYATFMPLLWVLLLVTILLLPTDERHLIDRRWFFAVLLVLCLAWLVAADHELAIRHSLLVLAAVVLFGLARRANADDRIVTVVALGVSLTAIVALGQALGGLERARTLLGELPVGWREAAATRLSQGRVFGTAALPGHFAALLLLAAPLVVERAWNGSGWRRAGWGAILVVLATATVLTRSLAALLVVALLLLPVLVRHRRNRKVQLATAVLLLLAALIVTARRDLLRLEPLQLRWVNWRTSGWVFTQHPWLGVGLGGVGQAGLVAPTAASNITPYAHNTYLQLTAELGLAGAGLLAASVWGLASLIRAGSRAHPGLALSVAVVPLHNLVDFSAYAPEVLLPWVVLTGILAGRTLAHPTRCARGGVLLALAGVGALLSTLAWRSEMEMAAAVAAPPERALRPALAAARWAPWTVTPLQLAAGLVLETHARTAVLSAVDSRLADRAWVTPVSASWAESRARLLLAQGKRGEALVWAREARRRAPWRRDVAELEAVCTASP